ncbi:MAG: hypothetical protein ACE5HT_04380 [Gemmatimonadales bacterium]
MTDRRRFLSALSALGAAALTSAHRTLASDTPRVDATTTIFFAQPYGSKNLVRFQIHNIDAPAGRLRVYNGSRKLLGTAGVLRKSEALYGELWLRVDKPTNVISELEAPGLRAPLRTTHRLVPHRRWTLNLLVAVDAVSLTREFEQLPPVHQAVQAIRYRKAHVRVNPFPTSVDLDHLDHVPFLRMAVPAMEIERRYGIPVSTVTIVQDRSDISTTSAMALVGSGVRIVALVQAGGDPSQVWEVTGGGKLLVVTVPAGGTPSDLRFGVSYDEMRSSVERWLTTSPLFLSPAYGADIAYVLATTPEEAFGQIPGAVTEWNARVAYPKIVIGDTAALTERAERRVAAVPVPKHRNGTARDFDATELKSIANLRARAQVDLVEATMTAVGGVGNIASRIQTMVPGTVVFNPAPYTRSGLVRMTDGTDRIATDVPGLGYAYFMDTAEDKSRWKNQNPTSWLEGKTLALRIDASTGAIASLINKVDGRELVRQDSIGLNAMEASRLERMSYVRLPGAAARIELHRWSPLHGSLTTTITLYDDLPWLDLANDAKGSGSHQLQYHFAFALRDPRVAWEIPAGSDDGAAPVDRFEHLRWISLLDDVTHLLFRGLTAPIASVSSEGTLTSHATIGLSRYRILVATPYSPADTPWVFGWEAEPFMTARVLENRAGELPTFGAFFSVDQNGAAVLGLKPADDGDGVILFIQELLGVDREIALGQGILRFRSIRTVDYLERGLKELEPPRDGVARVPVPANAVVAVRLTGVEQR